MYPLQVAFPARPRHGDLIMQSHVKGRRTPHLLFIVLLAIAQGGPVNAQSLLESLDIQRRVLQDQVETLGTVLQIARSNDEILDQRRAPPRIYIYLQSPIDAGKVSSLRCAPEKIVSNGWNIIVPEIRAADVSPEVSQLKFFRPDDASEAASLANLIRQVPGVGPVTLIDQSGDHQRSTSQISEAIRPRQFELWLRKSGSEAQRNGKPM